jgi:transcriptional regulator with XRE-family HTH domain
VGGVLETAGSGRGVRPAGETLAEVLITERYRRRLTQEQLAAKAGVSRDTLSELERGRPRLNGRAVGKVMQSLEIAEGRLVEIYGDALNGTAYQHCLSSTRSPGPRLSDYADGLGSLSDNGLLDEVAHDRRPSHRMAYLDAIERRWHSYEAFATNQPPLLFRDDDAIIEAARSLVGDDDDRAAYVNFRRAYRDQRTKWLEEHPTRRRHQVVISAAGLTYHLRSLGDQTRAAQLIGRMCGAAGAHHGTFTLLVLDTAGACLPEVEVVSNTVLDLSETDPAVGDARQTIAIHHLRRGPGQPRTHYDLAVHSDPPFVKWFFHRVRGLWFSALGQYRVVDPMPGGGVGAAVADLTVTRLKDCLNLAYP